MSKSSVDKRSVAIFLYETTGNMAAVFAKAGWKCLCIDIQNKDRVKDFPGGGSITFLGVEVSRWKPALEWCSIFDLLPDDVVKSCPSTAERK